MLIVLWAISRNESVSMSPQDIHPNLNEQNKGKCHKNHVTYKNKTYSVILHKYILAFTIRNNIGL